MRGGFLLLLLPIFAAANFDVLNRFSDFNRVIKTKQDFAQVLLTFNMLIEMLNGTIVPREIVNIVSSLSVNDYDAIKFVFNPGNNASAEHLLEMEAQFPRVYSLLATEGAKLLDRLKGLSNVTRDYITELGDLSTTMNKGTDSRSYLKMFFLSYLSWPQEQKNELDAIFPKLSTKFSEYLVYFMNNEQQLQRAMAPEKLRFEEEL